MVCVQVSYLAMQDVVDGEPCKLVLWSRGSPERFTLQASCDSIKNTWTETIGTLLDAQNNFLSGENTLTTTSCQVKTSTNTPLKSPQISLPIVIKSP